MMLIWRRSCEVGCKTRILCLIAARCSLPAYLSTKVKGGKRNRYKLSGGPKLSVIEHKTWVEQWHSMACLRSLSLG